MKCNHCRKTIPEVSLRCPYCKEIVDPNDKPLVDLGIIDSTDYDNKFKIKSFLKDEDNGKNTGKTIIVITIIVIIVLIIMIIVILAMMFGGNKSNSNYLYEQTINTFFEYIIDNYTNTNATKSGTFELGIKVNEDEYEFFGEYGLDISNKIVSISSKMDDPRKEEGAIIIDSNLLNLDIYLKENGLYLLSEKLHSKDEYIYLPINDQTGLLKTRRYDISSLITGVQDALLEALGSVKITMTEDNIIHRGEEKSVEKHTLLLDAATKRVAYVKFLQTLLDDANFINEYARVKDTSTDEIKRIIENYITTVEYRYGGASEEQIEVAIYYKAGTMYRIEFNVKEEHGFILQIDISDSKYYISYFEGEEYLYGGSVSALRKESNNGLVKDYEITFDSEKYIIDIGLEVTQASRAKVNKKEIDTYKDIKDFDDADYDKLKRNLKTYFKNVTWIDRLDIIFKAECDPSLVCRCEDNKDTCSCSYEGKIIECPKELVEIPNDKPDSEDETTTTTTITSNISTTISPTTTTTATVE